MKLGSVDGVSVGPTQRVNLHRKHMQKCEAITGSLEEKNTLVVIQFAVRTPILLVEAVFLKSLNDRRHHREPPNTESTRMVS